jgi:hypothetical protein
LVQTEAMLVISFTVTLAGALPPSTARNASAELSPALLLTPATPPLATI